MSKTNPASGMRDFLPVDVRKREYVIGIIKQTYESYGYEPLETPAVENIETLMGKYGEEGNQLVFKILKRGEKLAEQLAEFGELAESSNSGNSANSPNSLSDLALRYDLTVPLARVVADRRNELPKFFKRYQIQPVWRADRPARGRFREFYQCDADAIGSTSAIIEAEIISAATDILERLGFDDFVVRINHRQLLSQIATDAGVTNETEAFVALDKLDRIGQQGVLEELVSRGVDQSAAEKFLSLVTSDISNPELDHVIELCHSPKVKIDPSLARGLSYYTGTIMEINVPDIAGSLGGGGRYDGLIGMFGKEQIPACGFSLGLERILVVMDERGMFPPEIAESRAADVMVTIWNEETIPESLKLADELRKQNLRVLVYPEADKLGKQIKYADSIGVPFVCVLGESELAEGKVTVKNMKSGEQKVLERDQIMQVIKI
ncbi:MAG TPA: histidine--tRNA ligase [Pyrinomonadaceae bacterium]